MDVNRSEAVVLRTIMLTGNGLMKQAMGLLTPADFSTIQNQKLFLELSRNYQSNRPCELQALTLTDRELAYAATLNADMPMRDNFEKYIHEVKEASEMRKLHSVLSIALETTQGKTAADKADEIGKALRGFRPILDVQKDFFIDFERMVSTIPEEIDWLVDGIIQRGANGIIAGVPKASKSWIAGDLGLSVALGCPWMGFGVTRPAKVALISREDAPGLTSWRLRALAKGKASTSDLRLLKSNFIVNTRQQTDSLMLDDPKDVRQITELLSRERVELAIFDVFNVLHQKDENDNKEMREVLSRLSEIQQASRSAIALVHHFNKNTTGSWTEKLRGSSAISGWVEWLIGITMADEATKTRCMEFELKAAQPPNPVYYQIQSEGKMSWLNVCEEPQRGNGKWK